MKNLIFISIILSMSACSGKKTHDLSYEEDVYTPLYSSNFKISGDNESANKLISVMNPWQGAENISSQLLIVRDSIMPDNFNGQVLNGEAKRIICMSSTHIAMLDALNETDRIVGVSGLEYITNPKLIAKSDLIPDIGYEGNINYEALLATQPDLVLLFSVNGASSMENKLKEFGIPFMYVGDYVEENPLGKAEWLIPIGEVTGKRPEALELFNKISVRYNNLKELVAEAEFERPSVMLNVPFGDSWFMPSSNSYVAQMIEDAGGNYIYEKNTGNSSEPIDMEEAFLLASKADFWLNMGTVKSKEEFIMTFPKFSSINCVVNERLFNNNKRTTIGGGNDCYESGVINPDLILHDMIKIFHPELVEGDLYYYYKLK